MAPSDTPAPFLRIPWAASVLKQPDIVTRVAGSRMVKPSNEDALFGDTLKTPNTLRSCLSFYKKPASDAPYIEEVSTLVTTGPGLDGHPGIMHGGIVATLIDEAMGILQSFNKERDHIKAVSSGRAEGELPPEGYSWFTAELKIKYLKPVMTQTPVLVTCRYTKRDGRKEWIYAEVKQRVGADEDYYGDEIVCATAEGLFISPRRNKL